MEDRQVLTAAQESMLATTFNDALLRVFAWMATGLLLTTIVAFAVARIEPVRTAVYGNPNIFFAVLVGQVALVITIAQRIDKLSPRQALALFALYSGLVGVTFSTLFMVYDIGTVTMAFGVAAAMFAAMATFGLTTHEDLTGWGPILLSLVFGLILALVAGIVLQSSAVEWATSVAGVVIFAGLTAYDSQQVKAMTAEAIAANEHEVAARVGVLGALNLYLDFLNLIIFILNLAGGDDS